MEKIYATIGGSIKVTKMQFDEIMKKQTEGFTVTQALILMGLETIEGAIESLEKHRPYSIGNIDKKIEELIEFGKTLDNKKVEEKEEMDLRVKYRTGREKRTKMVSGTGTREKYVSSYEVGVVTNDGSMTEQQWMDAVSGMIVEKNEQHIVDALVKYTLEEYAWINTEKDAMTKALDMYVDRLWENEKWVSRSEFIENYLEKKEVKILTERMESDNINSRETTTKLEKIEESTIMEHEVISISIDDLIKNDVFRVVRKVDGSNYMKNNRGSEVDHKIMLKDFDPATERYDAVVYDVVSGVEIVKFKLEKRRKYSIFGEIEIVYAPNKDDINSIVAEEVMSLVNRYGKIKKVVVQSKEVMFDVEGRNEDLTLELSDVLYRIGRNKDVKLQEVGSVLLDKHLELVIIEKEEVAYGDIAIIKNSNSEVDIKGTVIRTNIEKEKICSIVVEHMHNGKMVTTISTMKDIQKIVRVVAKECDPIKKDSEQTINKKIDMLDSISKEIASSNKH